MSGDQVGALPSGTGLSSFGSSPQAVSPVPASIPSADLPEILRRAADLIEPEGAWTQGAFSRNADGSIDTGGEDGDPDGRAQSPTCWCILGAVAAAAGHDLLCNGYPTQGPLKEASNALLSVLKCSPDEWNDQSWRKQDEVVAKLREAAQAIEARRAETLGSVEDESAVGETDAPNTGDQS